MFRFWALNYVKHLEDEITWYRERLDLERERAERAIDELLRLRVEGASPVHRAAAQETATEKLLEKLAQDPEFAQVGE